MGATPPLSSVKSNVLLVPVIDDIGAESTEVREHSWTPDIKLNKMASATSVLPIAIKGSETSFCSREIFKINNDLSTETRKDIIPESERETDFGTSTNPLLEVAPSLESLDSIPLKTTRTSMSREVVITSAVVAALGVIYFGLTSFSVYQIARPASKMLLSRRRI